MLQLFGVGWVTSHHATITLHNFFKESCQTIIRGQAIYDIQTMIQQPKDISYEYQMGKYDSVWAMYDSLCFQGNGSIINYKKAIEKCRDDIMRI